MSEDTAEVSPPITPRSVFRPAVAESPAREGCQLPLREVPQRGLRPGCHRHGAARKLRRDGLVAGLMATERLRLLTAFLHVDSEEFVLLLRCAMIMLEHQYMCCNECAVL